MGNEQRKMMLEAFKEKIRPTSFLSSFFRMSDAWKSRTKTVEIDVVRGQELIAIDVTPYTDGFLNVQKKWTTKEYNPPSFNEYDSYNAQELLDRVPGNDPYSDQSDQIASLLARVTDDQVMCQDKIVRAMEKMASEVLFNGTITLVNDAQIDYHQRTELQRDATAAWGTGSEDIPKDLEDLATAIRKYGKVTMVDVVFGETAWQNFLNSDSMEKRFNYRRVDLNDIRPPVLNTEGAAFMGVVSVGAYQLRCWTYPQYYDVPTDEELGLPNGTIANAGSTGVPYVPANKVLGMGRNVDLRWVYGGIATIVGAADPRLAFLGLSRLPGMVVADFLPYVRVSPNGREILIGVESRPMPVPTQIDGFGWVNTQP